MAHILVVDDKEMMRDSLQATLAMAGHEVVASSGAHEALEQLGAFPFDMIITDLKMPRMDGLMFIEEIRKRSNEIPIVMMTAYASIATAVEAMRKGAYDYIQKPFDADQIQLLVDRTLEHHRLLKENEALRTTAHDWQRGRMFIGSGPAMDRLNEQIGRVANSSASVLIIGESGTGKEMVARALHARSGRGEKPLLAVNCAALSSNLLESELFGHEKGAFTGADRARKGRFELSDEGTLLLDEVSEMDLNLQAKLLRVLQEREFERVGSSLTRQVDVRVLATTNRDLQEWVRQGKFREDLFYRLNVVPIAVPPLRERSGDDIEQLCEYFLTRCARREGADVCQLTPGALEMLKCYRWPGNVRELENLMERVSILGASDVITEGSLRPWLDGKHFSSPAVEMSAGMPDTFCIEDMERQLIKKALVKYDGHRQKTADALGIGLRTLGMKIKRWNMTEIGQAEISEIEDRASSASSRATIAG